MKREVQNFEIRKVNLEEAELVEEIKTLKHSSEHPENKI